MNNKPVLLLIGEASPIMTEITNILRADFAVRLAKPSEVNCTDAKGIQFFVCAVSPYEIDPLVFQQIQLNVIGNDGVLLILESGLEESNLSEYFNFIGAQAKQESTVESFKLHVFPHYLTRGIFETVEIKQSVRANLLFCDGFSRISDNVFIEDMSANPVAYERVYGTKGRIIVLAVRGINSLSKIENGVLSNLHLLLHTAENVNQRFCEEITNEIPFQEDIVVEQPHDVCRWNTLFTSDKTVITYTHSAIFLPGSPEFCKSRLAVWSRNWDGEFTKERLDQSFMGVEIRNTDFCPQNCYYCYNRREMDVKYVRSSLPKELHVALENDLIKMKDKIKHPFFIRYTGTGEPLNHPRTLPSLMAFEEAGIPTALITNGELLSGKEAAELGRRGTYVRFSVDASDAKSYAAIRRCAVDTFEKVKNNMAAVARGRCCVGATFLVCRENFRQVFNFTRLMKALGVNAVWIRSTDGCEYFSDDDMKQISADIDLALTLVDENFIVTANQFKIYREISLLHYKYDTVRCWSGHTKAFIQPNGNVIICLSRPDYVIGNIQEQSFSQIWGGERHLRFLREADVTACSQCIESRYNSAADFLFGNIDKVICKGTRTLAINI
jgi:MoaA/NifB/PqqE/SkfB family radical SAM enzyme